MRKFFAAFMLLGLMMFSTGAWAQSSNIDNVTIGISTPQEGHFTNLEATTQITLGAESITNFSSIDDDKVKVSSGDTPGFLDSKIVAGSGVTVTPGTSQIIISAPPVNVEDSADGVEITFAHEDATDPGNPQIFIRGEGLFTDPLVFDSTVTVGKDTYNIDAQTTLPTEQQIIVSSPSGINRPAGSYRVKLKNPAGAFSEGLVPLMAIFNSFFTTATGGIITTDGDYKIHTFNSSGTFEVLQLGTVDPLFEYLVIGGGGGGGGWWGGGGGAGGYKTAAGFALSVGAHTVTVGGGGSGGIKESGNDGSDSVFSSITSTGGGGGGYALSGNSGGSGGGGGYDNGGGSADPSGQGNNGGTAVGATTHTTGGGGGAGSAGAGPVAATGGAGGDGLSSSITGSAVIRAGGGGGGGRVESSNLGGAGGAGGGGAGSGSGSTSDGRPGTSNTGGGGGGALSASAPSGSKTGGDGGSGVVIIRYKFQ